LRIKGADRCDHSWLSRPCVNRRCWPVWPVCAVQARQFESRCTVFCTWVFASLASPLSRVVPICTVYVKFISAGWVAC